MGKVIHIFVLFYPPCTSSNSSHVDGCRIIPSARTWMKYFANVFVIIEDSFFIRYALRHCEVHDYPTNTAFVCHNEPTYILSRTCTNEYYGAAGPCCKVDEIFNHLINDRADLFKKIKFAMHCDDDTYFRPDQILKWLATVDKAGLDDIPIIGNAARGHKGDTAMGVWHINGCTEVQSSGWYQPLMMNHAGMQRIAVAVKSKGLTDTCRSFDVTHDVGVETFAWIMGLNHIQIPRTEINGGHLGVDIFQPDQLIVHSLRHDEKDHCRPGNEETWPAKLRYNQKVVVGCGDVGAPSPFHDKKRMADMYDAFEYFRDNGKPLEFGKDGVYEWARFNCTVYTDASGKKKVKKIWKPEETPNGPVEELVIPTVTPLEGYSETDHGKQNDLSKKWVAYKMTDCKTPGSVGH